MKNILYTIALCLVSHIVLGQTTTENYVKNETYKKPVKTQAGINALETDDKIESITYFDGLGRPIQSIAKQAGGNFEDLITPIIYDEFGRQLREYLPYVRVNSSLGFDTNLLPDLNGEISLINQFYANKYLEDQISSTHVNAFSEKYLEASPLGRVMEQAAPGKDWLLDKASDTDHTIKFAYAYNTHDSLDPTNPNNDNVILYDVTFNSNNEPQLSLTGYYNPNTLYKTVTKDENWQPSQSYVKDHTTEEFKDIQGMVVLKRTYDNDTAHDTYYVYDDFGNLTYVLPPLAEASNGIPSSSIIDNLCYQYKYDYRNRLIEKKIPAKDWEYIVYDQLDRPVLTQDVHLRGLDRWLFTKYDAFDRVVYTGVMNSIDDRVTMQGNIDNVQVLHEQRIANSIIVDGTEIFYNNLAYPSTNIEAIYTINYYDDYNWDTQNSLEASYDFSHLHYRLLKTNNSITKNTTGNSWNSGFKTEGNIFNDGFIEWTVTQTDKRVRVGLSRTDSAPDDSATTIDYSIDTGSGTLSKVLVYEEGVQQVIVPTYFVIGDTFKVERIGNQIYYKKNEEVFHISNTTSSGILIGDSSFHGGGVTIEDVHIGYSTLGQSHTQRTKGLSTGSKVRVLGTDHWIHSEIYYDQKARPILTFSKNTYLEKADVISTKLDFTGKVLETHASHIDDSQIARVEPIVTVDKFSYDHADRLLRQVQSINDQKDELLVKNSYDELGQLYKKDVGGTLSEITDYVNTTIQITVEGNAISKSGNNGHYQGLSTFQSLSGDGYVSFKTITPNRELAVGLSYVDTNADYDTIDYAIYVQSNGNVKVMENNNDRGVKTYMSTGDTFSVERREQTIYYLKNDVPFYRSLVQTTNAPMVGDATLISHNTTIENFVLVDLDKELQEVDYTYNIRGWLKTINDHQNLGNDLFAFKLNYNSTEIGANNDELYNGNISETLWKTAYDINNVQRGYAYTYDALNRLKIADYGKKSTGAFDRNIGYKVHNINYDLNGNIKFLERNGNNTTDAKIDELTYTYSGNQLQSVTDAANGNANEGFKDGNLSGNDYVYDANGNMTQDLNKGISSIQYNHLNLPTRVEFHSNDINIPDAGVIEYVYDATGIKLKKYTKETSQASGQSTYYAAGFIYQQNDAQSTTELKMFSQPEGYVEPNNSGGFDYAYQYKDHLGNVRLTYMDDSGAINYEGDFNNASSVTPWKKNFGAETLIIENDQLKCIADKNYRGTYINLNLEAGKTYHITYDVDLSQMNLEFEAKVYGPTQLYSSGFFTASGSYSFNVTALASTQYKLRFNVKDPNISNTSTPFAAPQTFFIDNVNVSEEASLQIIEENNYYPFGLKHKGYNDVVSANVNSTASKFKYNGKELQDELGLDMYDYGARNYDPALGRWFGIDELAEDYYSSSPYAFVGNNPMTNLEIDGRFWIRTVGEDGTITYTAEKGDSAMSLFDQHGETDGFSASQANDMVEGQLGENYRRKSDNMLMSDVEIDDVLTIYTETESEPMPEPEPTPEPAPEPTETQVPDFGIIGDITGANAVMQNQNYALDVYEAEGMQAYIYTQISIAHREEMAGRLFGSPTFRRSSGARGRKGTTNKKGTASAKPASAPKTVTVSGKTKTVQTGSKGGKYYINKNGNKTYLNRDGTKRN